MRKEKNIVAIAPENNSMVNSVKAILVDEGYKVVLVNEREHKKKSNSKKYIPVLDAIELLRYARKEFVSGDTVVICQSEFRD